MLTNRATQYVKKQERRKDAVTSLDIIEKAFAEKNFIPTQALLDFQLRYGGLMIYVGLEPICFGILHGELIRGMEFTFTKKPYEILHHPPDDDIPAHYFVCADTRYQEFFCIDEYGKYYEGWELRATNFDYIIEDTAIYNELNDQEMNLIVDEYAENRQVDVQEIYKHLGLSAYPDYPIDLIHWGKKDGLAVRIAEHKIQVFSREEQNLEIKNQIRLLLGKSPHQPSLTKGKSGAYRNSNKSRFDIFRRIFKIK